MEDMADRLKQQEEKLLSQQLLIEELEAKLKVCLYISKSSEKCRNSYFFFFLSMLIFMFFFNNFKSFLY